ncbi:hypothetical protein ACOSQ2_031336 [Xanthoceras sorbifolium]
MGRQFFFEIFKCEAGVRLGWVALGLAAIASSAKWKAGPGGWQEMTTGLVWDAENWIGDQREGVVKGPPGDGDEMHVDNTAFNLADPLAPMDDPMLPGSGSSPSGRA